MPPNAADRKSIRRLEKASKLADAQRRQVITSLMSTTFGREWMWDVLSRCHCFSTTFTGDALSGAFAEGQRAIGLSLLSDIMIACPDQYIQAQRESNERSSLDERRSSAESERGDPGPSDAPDDDTGIPSFHDDRPGHLNYTDF
jgi:hypothetical protein